MVHYWHPSFTAQHRVAICGVVGPAALTRAWRDVDCTDCLRVRDAKPVAA